MAKSVWLKDETEFMLIKAMKKAVNIKENGKVTYDGAIYEALKVYLNE